MASNLQNAVFEKWMFSFCH